MPVSANRHELATPALVCDLDGFEKNLTAMSALWPGTSLRPHVKAFKSTAVAQRLAQAGHTAFCCATIREVEGMAAAGLGQDLLLANEVLDATRLGKVAASGARVTVAVDSVPTIKAAAAGGVDEVLIDVNVGLPRCGCDPADAGRLADAARRLGLTVRGVMGYEGHLMAEADREAQADGVRASMALLSAAHGDVGGDVVSTGGTGTSDIHRDVGVATEVQAGSYLFMDTQYAKLGLPFVECLHIDATVLSLAPGDGEPTARWAVADAGLKALGMDHGNPSMPDHGKVWFCSDEHITFAPSRELSVGERVQLAPAHVDPTIARHPEMWVVEGDQVVDRWEIDLLYW